ncbi:MAG: molybdopterin-dependent oxidoreductase, partial [Alphaproteobacteria bacterium]
QSRLGPVLCGDPEDLGDGPPVTALFVQNTNPAVVCPETHKCLEGLARDDLFVAVHEQFMTETAAMADIVLPATTFLEHDDFYTASGHTFLQVARAVIDPLPECRANHEVIRELASRVGASHPGFEMTAWELIDATFAASGHPSAEEVWRGHWHDCALPFEEAHFLEGFPHADRRFHFRADWTSIGARGDGAPALPGHWEVIDQGDAEHPYRLVAAPARSFLNTSFTETPGSRKREGGPDVMIHPDACARLGVGEGELVRLGNRLGSVVVPVRPFEGVQPDVVVVESVWPNSAFREGIGINALVSAEPGAPNGGAVFHDTAVWIRRA